MWNNNNVNLGAGLERHWTRVKAPTSRLKKRWTNWMPGRQDDRSSGMVQVLAGEVLSLEVHSAEPLRLDDQDAQNT